MWGRIISTHALTEGDVHPGQYRHAGFISTHALTEGDPEHPLRIDKSGYFNSRPHGGRHSKHADNRTCYFISTHALTEGDELQIGPATDIASFQLTPSRRATMSCSEELNSVIFQLTPSRRATSASSGPTIPAITFQLTPSRRATSRSGETETDGCISTHALTEGDGTLMANFLNTTNFNSRPHGGRRKMLQERTWSEYFNSRPHGGRHRSGQHTDGDHISTHALTEGD